MRYDGTEYNFYDAIGNPLSYNNGSAYTFTWSNGRQLTSGTKGSTSFAYTYNADGLRTQKVVNGVTTTYYWAGSLLAMMVVAPGTSSEKVLKFYYDAEGRPIYFDLNGTIYFYVTNLQGDVVALTDSYGEVVSYQYDAWGKPISTDYISSAVYDAMYYNPLRYRGYIYDNETGFYYLQSRYYDPVVGRFINSDGQLNEGFLGNNMFAYCGNNPVRSVDPAGTDFWDVYNTITGLLYVNPVEVQAIGIACWVAIFSGNGADLTTDFNNGCFNPFNQDESIALNAKVYSFYKGTTVVRHSIPKTTSCSIAGTIFLNSTHGETVLNHEFGHSVQEKMMGPGVYLTAVAAPSLYTYLSGVVGPPYYSKPWERAADYLGGVDRGGYEENSLAWGIAELVGGTIVAVAYWLFGG